MIKIIYRTLLSLILLLLISLTYLSIIGIKTDKFNSKIISQFKEEHKTKKVDFDLFSKSLLSIEKNIKKIESAMNSLEIKNSSLELIDKSILYFAINEMLFGELDKPVVIDESLRLSKKFSSPESYKFINVSLDKFLKTLK